MATKNATERQAPYWEHDNCGGLVIFDLSGGFCVRCHAENLEAGDCCYVNGRGWRIRQVRAEDAVTHYTPEEPDQPACDADTRPDAPGTMFGTLNPDRVTCPGCRASFS